MTRMSLDQKQTLHAKSSEDERAHIEANLRGSIAESEEITHDTGSGTTSVNTATTTTPPSKYNNKGCHGRKLDVSFVIVNPVCLYIFGYLAFYYSYFRQKSRGGIVDQQQWW